VSITTRSQAGAAGVSTDPTPRWQTHAQGTGVGDLTVDLTTMTTGNMLLAFVGRGGTSSTGNAFDTPANWTLRAGPLDLGTTRRLYIFSRVNDGSASVTFVRSAGTQSCKAVVGSIIGGTWDTYTTTNNGASTTHTVPSVTTSVATCLVVAAAIPGAAPATGIAGYTERYNNTGTSVLYLASKGYPTAGATGDVTYTVANSQGLTVHISLKPV
jgi:hypothetical protein